MDHTSNQGSRKVPEHFRIAIGGSCVEMGRSLHEHFRGDGGQRGFIELRAMSGWDNCEWVTTYHLQRCVALLELKQAVGTVREPVDRLHSTHNGISPM